MTSNGCPTLDNLDDRSKEWLFDAVDLGVKYAELDDGFVPLATILGEDGSRNILKLVGDENASWSQEDAIALGRGKLRELDEDAHCVTLVYDGYFTGDGERTEAVFVEAYELGRPAGVHMCQRYERSGDGVRLVGNPMLLYDEQEPLVAPDRAAVEYPNLGPEAKSFALEALQLGLERAEAGDFRIVPFATILGGDGSRDLWRFVDDEAAPTVGGGLDLGRQRLLSVDRSSHCVSLVWGGDMQPDDSGGEFSPTGVVFVECYELGRPGGVVLAQGYLRDDDFFALSGDVRVLEEAEPLIPADRFADFPNLDTTSGEFTFELIDLALEEAAAHDAGFLPFAAVLGGDGARDLWRLVDDEHSPTVEGCLALGRRQLRELGGPIHCAALVWDGYITFEGEQQTEAVFVESFELGRQAGALVVQRYGRHDGGFDRIRIPVVCDEPEPLVPPRPTGREAAIARIRELAEQQKRR
ncbi:hypothetical protein ABZ639_23090 [Saccharomonospora sp. NPDC006951]